MVFRNAGFSMNLQNNKFVRLHLPSHVTNDMKTRCCFEIRILIYLDRHELTLHATCLRWNRQNYKMYDTQQHRCFQIRGCGTTRVRRLSSEFIWCPRGEPLETDMVIHGVYASMNWMGTCSGNVLSPVQRQAIIWTDAELLSFGPFGTNFGDILIEILIFIFKKLCFKNVVCQNGGHFVQGEMS